MPSFIYSKKGKTNSLLKFIEKLIKYYSNLGFQGDLLILDSSENSIFAGEKLLTTPNPDFNGDLALFDKLGLIPMKPYKKGDKPKIKASYKDKPINTKNPKWSRPKHKIERNELAKKKSREVRKSFEPRKVVSVKKL